MTAVAEVEPRGLAEFHSSVECGLMSAVKEFLKTPADAARFVNTPTAKGVSPLMLSVLNPTASAVTSWLLSHRALVNYVQPDSAQTAMHWACSVHNPQAVMTLLRAGALADVADTHGRTPLHYAALVGSEYVAHKLLKYCALQLERRLLNGGDAGSLSLLSPAAQAAAAHAAATGQPMPLIPLDPSLLALPRDTLGAFAAQALLNRPDASGYTPLMHAAEHGREGMVAFLLSKGAETHHRSKVGHTALVLADWYGHTACRAAIEQHMAVYSPPPVSAAVLPHPASSPMMDNSGAGTPSLLALPGAGAAGAAAVLSGGTPLALPPGSASYGMGALPYNAWVTGGGVAGSSGASPVVSSGGGGGGIGPGAVGLVHGLGIGAAGLAPGSSGAAADVSMGSAAGYMLGSLSRESQYSTTGGGPSGAGGRMSGNGGASVGLLRSGAVPGGLPSASGLSSSSATAGMGGWPAAAASGAAPVAAVTRSTSKLGALVPASSSSSSSYTLPKGATQHAPMHVHTSSVSMGRSLTEALGFTYPNAAAPPPVSAPGH